MASRPIGDVQRGFQRSLKVGGKIDAKNLHFLFKLLCPRKAVIAMARAGRKSKYDTHIKPHLNWVEQMCQTMTEEQIAKSLGVSVSTWCDYKNKHPELTETLKRGRQCLVADLRSALIRKAKGYEYTESKVTSEEVTWPKEMYDALLEAGFGPEEIATSRVVRTEVHRKQMAPDVAAINLALKNYDKGNWWNDPAAYDLKREELELKKKQIEEGQW